MGKPLTIQEEDDDRIEALKAKLGAKSKIDVVRQALALLESELDLSERVHRWKRAVKQVKRTSSSVNREFQTHSRIKRAD